ncbi:hypothetical protein Hanom_Chr09g00856051 [Helianthus anomalus]
MKLKQQTVLRRGREMSFNSRKIIYIYINEDAKRRVIIITKNNNSLIKSHLYFIICYLLRYKVLVTILVRSHKLSFIFELLLFISFFK